MLKELVGLLAAAGTGGLIYVISSSFNVTSHSQSFIEKSLAPSPVKYLSRNVKLTLLDHYKLGESNNGGCKLGLAYSKNDKTGWTLDTARNDVLTIPLSSGSSESKGTRLEGFLYGKDDASTQVRSKCQEKGKEKEENKKYLDLSGVNDKGQISTDDWTVRKIAYSRLV